MNTEQFAALRPKAGMTQTTVADALGVTSRTIAAWESAEPARDLSRVEGNAIRGLFQGPVLETRLMEMCDRAADAIYSEIVAIWLVEEVDCVLLRNANRLHDFERPFSEKARRKLETAESRLRLTWRSLTTYPLRSGKLLNLAGDAIVQHPEKRFKGNRTTFIAHRGMLESLLHVPALTPSPTGPHPVLLLSLQNKIDRETGEVIIAGDGQTTVYDADDADIAGQLAEEFKDELLEDMRLLEMVDLRWPSRPESE